MDEKDEKIHELTKQVAKLSASLERYKAAIRMLTRILNTSNDLIRRLEEIDNGNNTNVSRRQRVRDRL